MVSSSDAIEFSRRRSVARRREALGLHSSGRTDHGHGSVSARFPSARRACGMRADKASSTGLEVGDEPRQRRRGDASKPWQRVTSFDEIGLALRCQDANGGTRRRQVTAAFDG